MKPLEPIMDFLNTTIVIPWIGLPYTVKTLGPPRCEDGYEFTNEKFKVNCIQQCPYGWSVRKDVWL